jgi:homoserine kinase
VASGSVHADNAAPSLLGGLVLVPDWKPLRVIELRVPEELTAVHVHPHLEVETRRAREVLGDRVALADAVAQWGNTAALVTGLFREDWELISRAVVDRVAEPLRAPAVAGFQEVREAALNTGALAVSLSGSGPSMFALCRGRQRAQGVGQAMVEAFRLHGGVAADLIVSPGRAPGARVLEPS